MIIWDITQAAYISAFSVKTGSNTGDVNKMAILKGIALLDKR